MLLRIELLLSERELAPMRARLLRFRLAAVGLELLLQHRFQQRQ